MKSFVTIGVVAGGLASFLSVLKLTGFIDWPWLWVLSPLWIAAMGVAVFLTAVVSYLILWGP